MPSLRTRATKEKYQEFLRVKPIDDSCPLCNKVAIKEYGYWKLTVNDFPYDEIAKVHHMLLPIRHTSEKELSEEELNEFRTIKDSMMNTGYDIIIESTKRSLSIPGVGGNAQV